MVSADDQKTREDRRVFFEAVLNSYVSDHIPQLLRNGLLQTTHEAGTNLSYLVNASQVMNDFYWEMRDSQIAPLVSPAENSDGTSSSRVHTQLFKILSGIELTVSHAYIFSYDVESELSDQQRSFESLLNAHFGFYVAVSFLHGWEGWKLILEPWINRLVSLEELNSEVSYKGYPMNILQEHLHLVAYSLSSSDLMVFSNAAWWRMLCLYLKAQQAPAGES